MQANTTMGIFKTFEMHLKHTVDLMGLVSSFCVVFTFTWWRVQFIDKDKLVTISFHVHGVTRVQVYFYALFHTKPTETTHERSNTTV
jgi:hypothetical protein